MALRILQCIPAPAFFALSRPLLVHCVCSVRTLAAARTRALAYVLFLSRLLKSVCSVSAQAVDDHVRLHNKSASVSISWRSKVAPYNRMLGRSRFWNAFARPWLLLFEGDTVLCPEPTVPLDSFLRAAYPYYGAPWYFNANMCPFWSENNTWEGQHETCAGGNSGLSLYKRPLMSRMTELFGSETRIQQWRRWFRNSTLHAAEYFAFEGRAASGLIDQWTSTMLHPWLPPSGFSAAFSVETTYNGTYTPFGMHNPVSWLSKGKNLANLQTKGELQLDDELLRRCPPAHRLWRRYEKLKTPTVRPKWTARVG